MPLTCDGLPIPTVPDVALSGLALSQAINSRRSLAGSAFLPTIKVGASGSSATGSKSFTMS